MKCSKCDFYERGDMFNVCGITESECFREKDNCTLVNDDGTINKSDPYFSDDPADTGLRGGEDDDPFAE